MTETIHPTAVVHPAARLGEGVTIGPYAIIEDGVELGDQCAVQAHAIVRTGSILGRGCVVDSHAVIGGLPQDLRFDPRTPTGVRLGAGAVIRESATIHRATTEGAYTEVGEGAFLMVNAHVAHDCVVGAHAVLANNVMLGGFVQIGAHAFLGGAAAIHQRVRIGQSAMVGGVARCSQDVPPFTMVAERDELVGLNLVGLKRRGFTREAIRSLKLTYLQLFREQGNLREMAAVLLQSDFSELPEVRLFLDFFQEGKRGFAQPVRRVAPVLDPSPAAPPAEPS